MNATEPVKCRCGRTVPPLSPHRPGAAHPGLQGAIRSKRKSDWCPDTDMRKKKAEEDAAQAKIAAEAAEEASKITNALAAEPQTEVQP